MMRKILFLLLCVSMHTALHAQTPRQPYIYTIKADSVKITNSCDTAELIIENHTQNVSGFLFNKGRGRTEFRRGMLSLNDSVYLIGTDTLDFDKILSGRYFKQGGNRFGTTALLGTKDNYPLTFIQNGNEKGRISTNGNWLFNTTDDKGYLAQFNGGVRVTDAIYFPANVRIIAGAEGGNTDNYISIGRDNTVVYGAGSVALGYGVRVEGYPVAAFGVGFHNFANNGIGIMGSTDFGIAIGDQSYAGLKSIALGLGARTTGPQQFVCGGPNNSDYKVISDVYFGSGVNNAGFTGAGASYTINGSGAYGTDNAGGNITIAGGKGTGAGTPGHIIFSTAARMSSDTLLQSLYEKARIVGNTGNILINTTTDNGNKLNVNGTVYISDTLKMPNMLSKSDASSYKPMAVDASGNVVKMDSWNASATRKSAAVTGSSYTVPSDIDVVFVNYTGGQATITLPTGTLDREITIKNLNTSNTVIVSGLDTNESNSIATRGAITVKYTGSAWVGISKY